MRALQDDLARLVPDARLIVAAEGGHDVLQVVAAVRDPRAWATAAAGTPTP